MKRALFLCLYIGLLTTGHLAAGLFACLIVSGCEGCIVEPFRQGMMVFSFPITFIVTLGFLAYRRISAAIILGLGIVLLIPSGFVSVVAISWPESVNLWDPNIDTQYGENFSYEAFAFIQPGMTKTEVIQLIGKPLVGNPHDRHEIVKWLYSSDAKLHADGIDADFAWRSVEVDFKQGRVVRKICRWCLD